jgi:hypothetical protein
MICDVCYLMLREYERGHFKGAYNLPAFNHHTKRLELRESSKQGCCICRSLFTSLEQMEIEGDYEGNPESQNCFITAGLSFVTKWDGVYRLDFKLGDSEHLGSFILKPTRESSLYKFSYNVF